MLSDLRYALRLLGKSPWFTSLTVLVLAGGLAISIYTYAALSMMIYRDLPLPESGSMVRIGYGGWPNFRPLDAFELAALRAQSQSIDEIGVYRQTRALVGDSGSSRTVLALESDWRVFEFTRVEPLLGRGFVREDAAVGAEPVAVLGYATWQSAFAGDSSVVGTLARINGQLTRIVGVMPEGYAFPSNRGIWLPLAASEVEPVAYSGSKLDAYARLRRGVSMEAAKTELTALVQRTRLAQPDADERDLERVSVLGFQEASWGVFGDVVFGVLNFLAVSILLLSAVNIGNLLLARTNARMNEIGVRIALGAPRWRLLFQTTLENVVVCALGGALAVFLAARAFAATGGFTRSLMGDFMPFWWTWTVTGEAVAVTCILLLLTVFVVSMLPARTVNRADPNALLKDGARAGRGLETGRISRALVTLQIALISALTLIGGVATLIAGRLASFDFGLDTANLYTMGIQLPDRYATAERQLSFYDQLLAELRTTPGVEGARVMIESGFAAYNVAGDELATAGDRPTAWLVVLSESPDPLGPPLIEGRTFGSNDDATGLKTALVSRTLAAKRWPGKSPVGETLEVTGADALTEERVIVGVVGDLAFDPVGLGAAGNSAIYLPLPQHVRPATRVVVRHFGEEAVVRSAMYEAAARIDPSVAPDIRTYASMIDTVTVFGRTMTKLFAACGAFAILLGITGIYGMSSNAVVLRTHEIGLRRALGATNLGVVALFVRQSARQLAVGLALSALLSVGALVAIRQSFSIGAGEIAAIGATVMLVMCTTVLLSVYLSVQSAIRLDPSSALRQG